MDPSARGRLGGQAKARSLALNVPKPMPVTAREAWVDLTRAVRDGVHPVIVEGLRASFCAALDRYDRTVMV